jgi:hypothetical protein
MKTKIHSKSGFLGSRVLLILLLCAAASSILAGTLLTFLPSEVPAKVSNRNRRMTFGSVPSSAQSLVCDSAGKLLVVDPGGVNSGGSVIPNAIYKFTPLGARSTFASGSSLDESFAYLAVQPMSPLCCQ